MDKSQYIDKCMALLDDTKVYKSCRDTTKNYRGDVQEALQQLHWDHSTSRLYCWSKQYYNKLLPTGNSSPSPRFYGLPKIHKANCPMQPIVSAWGTATYHLAKFLTKILQKYTGMTPTFVKTVKGSANTWGQYTLGKMKSWSLSMYQLSSPASQSPQPWTSSIDCSQNTSRILRPRVSTIALLKVCVGWDLVWMSQYC